MKEQTHVKIIAIKKGMPKEKVGELIRTMTAAWNEQHPGEPLFLVPVEMDDISAEKDVLRFPPLRHEKGRDVGEK